MDRLVKEGMAFTCAYTPSPVCISGRCCMVPDSPRTSPAAPTTSPPESKPEAFIHSMIYSVSGLGVTRVGSIATEAIIEEAKKRGIK